MNADEKGLRPMRACVIGCNAISTLHLDALRGAGAFETVALADVSAERRSKLAQQYGVERTYEDYRQMLLEEKPEIVVVATPNSLHAAMTIFAAEAGVCGICCEKPMAVCMAEGRAMLDACRRRNTVLIVNHQRRFLPHFLRMRELLAAGEIGEVDFIRCACNGDLLTDGTHLIDLVRFLNGDKSVAWVLGQVHLPPQPASGSAQQSSNEKKHIRYGHKVELGAMAIVQFEQGPRVELYTGSAVFKDSGYCEVQVFGAKGRLWYPGERYGKPPQPLLLDKGAGWRTVETAPWTHKDAVAASYRRFVETLRAGTPHPLDGESALKDLELAMAVFESARIHSQVALPLAQDAFPLDLMMATEK